VDESIKTVKVLASSPLQEKQFVGSASPTSNPDKLEGNWKSQASSYKRSQVEAF
jgi:hypothetical protein